MAATPKARLATRDRELAFPIPRQATPARHQRQAHFAFPPPVGVTPTNGIHGLAGRLEPDPLRDTFRQKPTVKTRKLSASDATSSLELVASWVERAPLPALPDSVWTFLGRAWFFIAGTSLGVIFAFAVIAATAQKSPIASKHHARVVANDASARALIIEKATMTTERTYGEMASNDDIAIEAAPSPIPTIRPRTAAIIRKPATTTRRASGNGDILNAGL